MPNDPRSHARAAVLAGALVATPLPDAELVRRIEVLQDHLFAGVFRPVQEAGLAALVGPQESVEARRAAYEARAARALRVVDGRCEGTFFVWFRLPDGVTVERLLDEHRVAVAPGEGFGERGGGHARLSLAVSDELLERGLARLQNAFA
jgi:aminotransferase